ARGPVVCSGGNVPRVRPSLVWRSRRIRPRHQAFVKKATAAGETSRRPQPTVRERIATAAATSSEGPAPAGRPTRGRAYFEYGTACAAYGERSTSSPGST